VRKTNLRFFIVTGGRTYVALATTALVADSVVVVVYVLCNVLIDIEAELTTVVITVIVGVMVVEMTERVGEILENSVDVIVKITVGGGDECVTVVMTRCCGREVVMVGVWT
jgi:hypothetical protein